VSSRFLVGLGGWLLGAVAATTGSMIAVDQLANGLLSTQSQQLAGTTISADLDAGAGSGRPTPDPSPSASASPASSPSPAAAPQGAAQTLLTSADGSVLATCQATSVYLIYWSPAQGFSADDVARGPAVVASVTFENQSGGLIMRVSCPAGTPQAQVHWLNPGPDDSPSGSPTGSPSATPSASHTDE
jgi:hypothetical protein